MGVVVIPGREPLGLRNQTLRELCARAAQSLAEEQDREELEQAGIVSDVDFDSMRPGQRERIAAAVKAAALAYRADILAAGPDANELSRAEALAELALCLEPLASG